MKDNAREPLFTAKGWAALAVLACVYGAILFSLDREWVTWAAPLAFGGALVASGPPPASVQFSRPGQALPAAYLFSLACLVVLSLLPAGTSRFAWLHWLKEAFHGGGLDRLRSHGKSRSVPSH